MPSGVYERKSRIVRRKDPKTLANVFEVLTPEACYWAGVLATDGRLVNQMGKKAIGLNCCDSDVVVGFADFIGGVARRYEKKGGGEISG
jgi:hypothetical protein